MNFGLLFCNQGWSIVYPTCGEETQRIRNESARVNGRLLVPSVTLRDQAGRVDPFATLEHIERLAARGAQGVVLCGTTGEGHVLSFDEKFSLTREVGEARQGGGLPADFSLVLGLGTVTVGEAVQLVHWAQHNNFDGVLVLPPTEGDPRELFRRVAIAADSGDPSPDVYLYNYPEEPLKRGISPQILTNMGGFPSLMGVKDSSLRPDPSLWLDACARVDFVPRVFCGRDEYALECLRAGAFGAIAGLGNTERGLPLLVRLFQEFEVGGGDEAQEELRQLAAEMQQGEGFLHNVHNNLLK